MSVNNKILTYMIENLGLPLMGAVGHAQKKKSTPEKDAEVMAKMLTSSVDLGMAISSKMNVPTDNIKAEALRFRLTALSANALSDRSKLTGKEPSSADIDSLKAVMDSLFVFSDNFSVNEEGQAYLEKIGMQDVLEKEVPQLYALEALLPVISAMDHKDRGIFTNIAERLIKESNDLSDKFAGNIDTKAAGAVIAKHKVLELLSHTFANIYVRVIADNKSIGDVWQEFDRKKALVILLMDYLLTGQKNIETAEQTEAGTQAPPTSPPEVEPAEVPVSQEQPAAAAISKEEEKAEEGESSGGGSPLGFFKK